MLCLWIISEARRAKGEIGHKHSLFYYKSHKISCGERRDGNQTAC